MSAKLPHGPTWIRLLPLVAAFASALPAQAAERALTVDDIFLARRFRGAGRFDLAWTPDSQALTFTAPGAPDAGGARIVREGLDGATSVLTTEAELAAQSGDPQFSLDHYELSPDGRFLLLTGTLPARGLKTGGNFETFDLQTRRFVHRTRNDADQRIIQLSPDAARVGFVRDNDLYVVELATGVERRLTDSGSPLILNGAMDWAYEEEFGVINGWSWSPDGRRIAFYRVDQSTVPRYPYFVDYDAPHPVVHWMHYPKAGDPNARVRIGIIDIDSGATRWAAVDSGEDGYLPRMAWIDSGRLAVAWMNRGQSELALHSVDAATGATLAVLRQERSATWVEVHDDLVFLRDGSFLWTSESDGWNHLYRIDAKGGEHLLTPGDYDVKNVVAVDHAAGVVYFAAAAGTRETQIYAVPAAGLAPSVPVQVSSGRGTHAAEFAPDAQHYVDTWSNTDQPPKQTLNAAANGGLLRMLEDNPMPELSEYALGRFEPMQVPGADGTPLEAFVLRPHDFDPERRYPLLMYAYGGPGSQVVTDSWQGARGMWYQLMAQRGYIVAMVDGRGTGARGKRFRESVFHNLGALESDDQIAAARHFATLPYIDPARIGLWGWSYGGYLTAITLTRGGSVFKAGISVAPVSHWAFYDSIYTERYMGLPADNPDGYTASSPLAHVATMSAKLLIVHGSGDDNVHLQNSEALVNALLNAGKSYEFNIYPGRTHGIGEGLYDQRHLYEKMTSFLAQNL